MAEPVGYLVPPRSYRELGDLVRQNRRTPIATAHHRRRQSAFQPGAGSKVYQCVFGTRLRAGIAADPDNEKGFYEPVAVCVQIGTTDNDEIVNLSNKAVFELQFLIYTMLLIVDAQGRIDQSAFDQTFNDDAVKSVIESELGEGPVLTLLRTRFCHGYVGTGSVVVGNDTEAWYGIGSEIFQAKLQAAWTDGTELVLAEITFNQPAINANVTDSAKRIFDRVAVRSNPEGPVFFPDGAVVPVCFNQQTVFSDDDSYEDEFFYNDDPYGWLPVFNLMARP